MNQIKSVLYITLLPRDVNLSFWSKNFFQITVFQKRTIYFFVLRDCTCYKNKKPE